MRGINRNIMECKDLLYGHNFQWDYGLIETLWNVKSKKFY